MKRCQRNYLRKEDGEQRPNQTIMEKEGLVFPPKLYLQMELSALCWG